MDKLKNIFRRLMTPAIVLLLVAVLTIVSPVASVAAVLYVNTQGVNADVSYEIANLPTRIVKLGSKAAKLYAYDASQEYQIPTLDGGYTGVKICHANREKNIFDVWDGSTYTYTYQEIGQYEWRFYMNDGTLFDTYTVSVTDATYGIVMPDIVPTVAPLDVGTIDLPLPEKYTLDGETIEIKDGSLAIDENTGYAKFTNEDATATYYLAVTASLGNNFLNANHIAISDSGVTLKMADFAIDYTGTLKVTYKLLDQNLKLLAARPLSDINIKNITKSDVKFTTLPTAPSVSSLAYYVPVTLTAPTAGSAQYTANNTSFNVEASTVISKVQFYGYSTKPNKWTDSEVINITLQDDGTYKSDRDDFAANQILEIDNLKVTIKELGWYRLQFKTTTLFGYQVADSVSENNYETDDAKSYVTYWSDEISIKQDNQKPQFKFVAEYNTADETVVGELNKNFDDIDDYNVYLPMTTAPDENTTQKITINPNDGITIPAVFPKDNATTFANLRVTVVVDRYKNNKGELVQDNRAQSADSNTASTFVYDAGKALSISFEDNAKEQGNNLVRLKYEKGLYRVNIQVRDVEPQYKFGENKNSSYPYPRYETKNLYFYVDEAFRCDDSEAGSNNAPQIDEKNVFQVSDVYLWEGRTFEFKVPTFNDNNTPNNNLQIDYYLVTFEGNTQKNVYELDQANLKDNRMTVDLDQLSGNVNADIDNGDDCYIYAVARNFNAMQRSLKKETGDQNQYNAFHTDLLVANGANADKYAAYGYAWKRAAFEFHKANVTSANATLEAVFPDGENVKDDKNQIIPVNSWKAGETVRIPRMSVVWGADDVVDGQIAAAVYLVHNDGTRVPIDLLDDADASQAEKVSSVSFYGHEYTIRDWYFTPGISGKYILVLTAKDHSSSQLFTKIYPIQIESSGDYTVTALSSNTKSGNTNYKIEATISLGETGVLPNWLVEKEGETEKYFAKNRQLFAYDANGNVDLTDVKGYYTITVAGVIDVNCVIGNKFVPNQIGTYVFHYDFYKKAVNPGDKDILLKSIPYAIQVLGKTDTTSSIRMGEDYGATIRILWEETLNTSDLENKRVYTLDKTTYELGSGDEKTGTATSPAYAITLPEFTMSNYGGATNFIVDSAVLRAYLEPKCKDGDSGEITEWMYPAIAIPMPNVITDTTSSDEVEITVQKTNDTSNYLVSNKSKNAGSARNQASVIKNFDKYFVFRPEGTFFNNGEDYLNGSQSSAGVYVVTYSTTTTNLTFNITFGNPATGTLNLDANFLTYQDGDQEVNINAEANTPKIDPVVGVDDAKHRYVTIHLDRMNFSGNGDMLKTINAGPDVEGGNQGYLPDDAAVEPKTYAKEYLWQKARVSVWFEDAELISYNYWADSAADDAEKFKNHDDYTKTFALTSSGKYTVKVSVQNVYTGDWTRDSEIEFTIDVKATNKNTDLSQVWGIILIILSVGLLAGVIFYFIKTARATRFLDTTTPRAPRAKGKAKVEEEAPKAVEEPAKDAE